MKFAPRRHRQPAESVVPMINVVFLLLIFFMMSATIMPPAPFDLTLPQAGADADPAGDQTMYLSATGEMSFEGAFQDAAWELLAAKDATATLTLRADAALEARAVAQVLSRLAELGRANVELVVRAP